MNNTTIQQNITCDCCTTSATFNPIDWFKTLYASGRKVINQKWSKVLFLPLTLLFWTVFLAIPVFSIPSNTFAFQFSLFTITDYIVLTLLALLGSLLLLTHVHYFIMLREKKKAGVIATGSVGGVSSVFASIFGAASCPMCVASLFGFLGLGTIGFLVNYQWVIFTITTLMVVISLYFTTKKIVSLEAKHDHE